MRSFLFKVFLVLFVFGVSAEGFGQYFESAINFGGQSNQGAADIVTDLNGNIFITGSFEDTTDFDPGSGVYNLISNGGYDIYISKSDSNGNLIWVKGIGASGNDVGARIAIDNSGNVYISGYFTYSGIDFDPGPGVYTLSGSAFSTGYVLKLNNNGDFEWARSYGGSSSYDHVAEVVIDVNNNVYVTGAYHQTFDFDPGPGVYNLSSNGHRDIFITKLDSNGVFVWAKSIGAWHDDTSNGLVIDSIGYIYITGMFENYIVDFDPGPGVFNLTNSEINGTSDVYILKLDNNGNFVWVKSIRGDGGVGADNSKGIALDGYGNIYINGIYENTSDFDPGPGVYNLTSVGYQDFFILKLDSNGTFIWVNTLFGAYPTSIYVDDLNKVYLAGRFSGVLDFDFDSGIYNLDKNNGHLFILKINELGGFQWVRNFGIQDTILPSGSSYGGIGGMHIDENNSMYITGTQTFTFDFDPGIGVHNLTSNGGADIFIMRLADCEDTYNTSSVIRCNTYTSPSGSFTYSSPGYYTILDTIPNHCGYDSILTINLTLNYPSIGTFDTIEACHNYTWTNGITYYTDNNTALDTFTNICGLDSIVQLHLEINNFSYVIDTQIACSSSYTWIDGNTYTAPNSTATDTFINAIGCDSIIQLFLTFQGSSIIIDSTIVNSCNSYTWINGTTYASSNNSAISISPNGNGCLIYNYLDLTINNSINIINTIEACDSIQHNGQWYFSSQTINDTINTGLACDTIIETNLIVHLSSINVNSISVCDSGIYNGIWYNSSQVFNDTFTSIFGCDSVVSLNMTVLNSNTGPDSHIACTNYTWIDGVTYTSNNNTATHTIVNSAGCDSVVTLDLTILNSSLSSDFQTGCNSFVWIDGVTYTTNNNTATYTMVNSVGCDSIITLDLTLLSSSASDVQSSCGSFTWINGTTYVSNNNTASVTLTNAAGCDSIVTLDLTILNSTPTSDIQTACDTYTWTNGLTYTFNNNTATDTFINVNGCDSIVTLNLTIESSTTGTDVLSAPIPFTWIDGMNYSADNNTATETLVNSVGCDSVVTLNLTIIDTIIQGNIMTSIGNPLQNSKVYLIAYFSSQDSVFATDSTFTDVLGFYEFPNTFQNAYVKAIPDVSAYPNEVPTYNVSSAVFQNADAVYLSFPFGNTDFSTLAGVNPGGPGFIGGIVGNGAGKNSEVGEPLANISLVLMNASNNVVGQTTTDINGHFEFDNLAEETFSIWVDKAGVLNSLAPMISLIENNNQDDLKFVLHKTYLEDITTVGIEAISQSSFSIFPNPTSKLITIQNADVNETYTVELYSILGEMVFSKSTKKASLNIDLEKMQMSKGTYFVKISSEEGNFVSKVVYR